ncbi:MAG: ATP-dependent RecD-like DNA helicase [Gemmataceae bacterium]|nr:ATP-dependent RecD-like DNA helicase [Gemmataceae bacterium]
MAESLSGTIERITFHNPETGFAVLRVLVKGQRHLVTVVGQLPRVVAGEFLEAAGKWIEDRDHGKQFQAEMLRTVAPSTVEGIEKYLGSGLIKGIGPHYAHRIVQVFGERTLQIIDESPAFLAEIKGIGPRRVQEIRQSWQQQKAVRAIMVFLHSHGVGTARATRIYKTYGDKALELVKENPYRLANDIWGVGFQTADSLAQRLGIDRQSPLRARAALRHVLTESADEGHCSFPEVQVIVRAGQLTGIEQKTFEEAAKTLVEEKEAVRDDAIPDGPWLYLRKLYHAETAIAATLWELLQGAHPLPNIDVEAALGWVEKRMGLALAASQRDAIRQATSKKVLVITGGPGVGKTTLVRGILEIFRAKKRECVLCAPTGRAAKRLAELTGQEAKTIHRLLEYDASGPKRDRERPLQGDLFIVDEMSMVDAPLMHHLLKAVPASACLVLVGDVDQLPSVGPGLVLADIIASGAIPVVRLTEVFRQAQESGIVQAAHSVNQGQMPEKQLLVGQDRNPILRTDFYIIEVDQPEVILARIVTLIQERIPARFRLDAFSDIQVLTPMNRSELGVRNLNVKLQEILNPYEEEQPEVARFGTTFRPGDKVLQTVNNYDREVFNGDIGRVHKIDEENQELTVVFDGRNVVYDFEDLDELALAYALTIHKSQGSEYPAVIIPLHTQHYMLLQRNLLYTGITRGKKLVVLIGSRKALQLAVSRQDTRKRCTGLAWRLGFRSESRP